MKVLSILIAVILLGVGTAFADVSKDFSYGQTEDGCYYTNESKEHVYGKDGSMIGLAHKCETIGSSLGYLKQNGWLARTLTRVFWERVAWVKKNR